MLGVLCGALCNKSGLVLASSHMTLITSMNSSSVSFDSVSVGSTSKASSTVKGKYMVGGCMS